MSIKQQAENGRKAGGNQAVLNSNSRDSVETVGNTAESELRGGEARRGTIPDFVPSCCQVNLLVGATKPSL
jgi:hypothetical protein